ncbi:MAG: hypothetical protein KBT36_05855 [Kurthia sp.]|nr:hypothetical protein [Candidatus Kurthia equi]
MGTIQQLEHYLLLKLAHGETIMEYMYGLHANENIPSLFKASSLIVATNARIYICSLVEENFYCEEISYCDIQAIYHRERNLSGKESIIFIKEKRLTISHIEEGCPVKFMQYVLKKRQKPFSTTA